MFFLCTCPRPRAPGRALPRLAARAGVPVPPRFPPLRRASCDGAAGSDSTLRPCLSLQTERLHPERREQWGGRNAKSRKRAAGNRCCPFHGAWVSGLPVGFCCPERVLNVISSTLSKLINELSRSLASVTVETCR